MRISLAIVAMCMTVAGQAQAESIVCSDVFVPGMSDADIEADADGHAMLENLRFAVQGSEADGFMLTIEGLPTGDESLVADMRQMPITQEQLAGFLEELDPEALGLDVSAVQIFHSRQSAADAEEGNGYSLYLLLDESGEIVRSYARMGWIALRCGVLSVD